MNRFSAISILALTGTGAFFFILQFTRSLDQSLIVAMNDEEDG